jgi:prevent-host-death family protein
MKPKPVPIHRAKTELSRLIARACAGEEVIISRGREPVVRLVPIGREAPKRRFGALRGKLVVDDTFFEPLPDAELDAWES